MGLRIRPVRAVETRQWYELDRRARRERARAVALLAGAGTAIRRPGGSAPMRSTSLVDQLGDIVAAMAEADPAAKAEVYRQLGRRLNTDRKKTVRAEVVPASTVGNEALGSRNATRAPPC
jgi:hypothetical protein